MINNLRGRSIYLQSFFAKHSERVNLLNIFPTKLFTIWKMICIYIIIIYTYTYICTYVFKAYSSASHVTTTHTHCLQCRVLKLVNKNYSTHNL